MRRLTGLEAEGCARGLLAVTLRRLVKGTRHTWCYYSGGHGKGTWVKFVLTYQSGHPPGTTGLKSQYNCVG